MSNPYRHGKLYLEGSPESGEDHGSKLVQTSGVYHDTSPHHDHSQYSAHAGYQTVGAAQVTQPFESLGLTASSSAGTQPYSGEPAGFWAGRGERTPYDNPRSTPYQRGAQNFTGYEHQKCEPEYRPADDWYLRMSGASDHDTISSNEVMDSSYQMMESQDFYGDRRSDNGPGRNHTFMTFGGENSESIQASGVYEYAYDFQSDMVGQNLNRNSHQYQRHAQYGDPGQDPRQDPNRYVSEDLTTHKDIVNYQTTGMRGPSDGPKDPSLTSFSYPGNQLDRSQPGATSQEVRSQGYRSRQSTAFNLPSNSFAQDTQRHNEAGKYVPGDGRPYSAGDEYYLRMHIAVGARFDDMAKGLRRTEESILGFIEQEGLFWTREEDDMLRQSMMEDDSLSSDVMNRLIGNGRRFEDEVLERSKALALWDEAAREAARDENAKPRHQQSPASSQRSSSKESQSSRESSAEIKLDTNGRRFWTEDEMTTVEQWKAQNRDTWKGMEELVNLLPDRTPKAIMSWWHSNHRGEGQKKTPWKPEEFTRLKEYVAGHDDWGKGEELKARFPDRGKASCKEKWLADGIPWDEEEDKYLLGIQVQPDTDWAKVAAHTSMKGRSATEAHERQGFVASCRAQGKHAGSLGLPRANSRRSRGK